MIISLGIQGEPFPLIGQIKKVELEDVKKRISEQKLLDVDYACFCIVQASPEGDPKNPTMNMQLLMVNGQKLFGQGHVTCVNTGLITFICEADEAVAKQFVGPQGPIAAYKAHSSLVNSAAGVIHKLDDIRG